MKSLSALLLIAGICGSCSLQEEEIVVKKERIRPKKREARDHLVRPIYLDYIEGRGKYLNVYSASYYQDEHYLLMLENIQSGEQSIFIENIDQILAFRKMEMENEAILFKLQKGEEIFLAVVDADYLYEINIGDFRELDLQNISVEDDNFYFIYEGVRYEMSVDDQYRIHRKDIKISKSILPSVDIDLYIQNILQIDDLSGDLPADISPDICADLSVDISPDVKKD